MGRHGEAQRPRRNAGRWWIAAGISAVLAIAVTAAVLVVGDSRKSVGSKGDAARQRCETEIVDRLASSPSTAKFSEIEATSDVLDADSRDLFSLLEPPLKGVDHSRINVFNVAGVVDSPNEFGDTMHTPFTCRAYFLDGDLAHSLVLFDHHH